jgi:hypothetical protein
MLHDTYIPNSINGDLMKWEAEKVPAYSHVHDRMAYGKDRQNDIGGYK